MTITSTSSRMPPYAGNNSATVFPVTLPFPEAGSIRAILERPGQAASELALDTDFTVFGAGDPAGGSLTFPKAGSAHGVLAEGQTLHILRELPLTQERDWDNVDAIDAEQIEAGDDRLTMICQQLQEQLDRTLQWPATESDPDTDPAGFVAAAQAAQAAAENAQGLAEDARDAAQAAQSEVGATIAAATADATSDAEDARDAAQAAQGLAEDAKAAAEAAAASIALPLPIASGGTASTSASAARTALGLAIGSDVQAYDATILKAANIGATVQGYDADTLKSDVSRVRTRSHPGTCVALTDAATVTPDLTTGDSFTWAMGAARTLGNATIPGAGRWPILLTGNYTLSFNAAWAIDNAAVDPGTGTRVIWMYSVNGTEKRIRIEARA